MALAKHTKILTVFSFLRLKSPDIRWYQWIYPTLLFAILYGAHWAYGFKILQFDTSKLIVDLNTLMGILVGFYIAALAAVSSFTNETLDQVMKGRAPTISTMRQGSKIIEKLTRRRFLSILFGYCASISIVIYIYGVLNTHVTIQLTKKPWLDWGVYFVGEIAWIGFLWAICRLLVVTMLGLHYLVERMHRA